jgi:hypothetical protein
MESMRTQSRKILYVISASLMVRLKFEEGDGPLGRLGWRRISSWRGKARPSLKLECGTYLSDNLSLGFWRCEGGCVVAQLKRAKLGKLAEWITTTVAETQNRGSSAPTTARADHARDEAPYAGRGGRSRTERAQLNLAAARLRHVGGSRSSGETDQGRSTIPRPPWTHEC